MRNDPVSLVRRYPDPGDREVAGLVCSGLAFGRVGQVIRAGAAALDPLGPRPGVAVRRGLPAGLLAGFRHRWIGEEDLTLFYSAVGRLLREHGTLEALYLAGFDPARPDPGAALDAFSRRAKAAAAAEGEPGPGLMYFFPEPGRGSAAKRLCLFLRWMIRPDDGIDLGVWRGVSPASLVIPLDTHVLRISRYLGLTAQKTATWATATEITAALGRLDPADPVRFDFAIAQLGISRGCLHRYDPGVCGACPLDGICSLSRPGRRASRLRGARAEGAC